MTDEPVTHPGAPSRTPRVLAIALFALALAGCLTAIVTALASGMSFSAAVNAYTVTDGAMALAFPVCGVLLAWHRPRNPIGWLFLAAGLGMASTTVVGPLLTLGAQRGWSQVTLRILSTVGSYGWPWTIALFVPLALILFPDGRLPGRRWRWLIWATVVDTLPFIASLGSPDPQLIGRRRVSIYLAPPHYHQLGLLWTLANLLWAVIFAGAIASLAVRYRRGSETERRQLLWLLLVGLILVPWVGVIWGVFNSGPILGLLALSLIPAAVTVAILRHQLLDIRVVVSRTLLYGLLTAAAVGTYAGLVALLDLMVRSQVSFGVVVVASIIVAFCFNPARVWLQRLVDRALYGDRIIDVAYRPQARAPWDQPTNYARTLLILALAAAGLGDLDQAVNAGTAALDCGRIVWPTMVLAGKLDQALARRFPGDMPVADFHARYLDAGTRLALPAPHHQPGADHR